MGKTEPRLWTPPLRELTPETSLGFACIDYATEVLRKKLYPWQKWALVHMMEIIGDLNGEWRFRFRTVLILISRQNGKTVLSEVIASFFLNVLCVDSVFGTSLSLDKAEEVWEAVVQDQESIPELSAELQRVGRTNGSKKLVLTGLRQYKVGAPTRRAGRGDSNDLVLLDEVREQRDWETWSASVASTNAKPNVKSVELRSADGKRMVLSEFEVYSPDNKQLYEMETDAYTDFAFIKNNGEKVALDVNNNISGFWDYLIFGEIINVYDYKGVVINGVEYLKQ